MLKGKMWGASLKTRSALLSVFSNAFLTLLKLLVGFSSGSISVISEAVHSGVDLLASVVAYLSVRVADQPPDKEHPYGHGKVEHLSGVVEGLLIFLAALLVLWEAVKRLVEGVVSFQPIYGIVVMAFSAVLNLGISEWLYLVAEETESDALEADAGHLRADVYTSAGVLLGLVVIHLTNWRFLDPLLAFFISLLVLRLAWTTTTGSLGHLLDTGLPQEEIDTIAQLAQSQPGVMSFHKLRTRRAGSYRYIDLHIQVRKDITVEEGHQIAHALQARIHQILPRAHIIIHIEPFEGSADYLEQDREARAE